jgi:MADS-box transcription factor
LLIDAVAGGRTFLKRKGGLFKKAHELSVLCSVDVAVIIFGHNKKLYEFSSGDINEIIGRYQYVRRALVIGRPSTASYLKADGADPSTLEQYGNPHEHKGPADFTGGKDGDDDDDEEAASPPPGSHSSQDPPLIPHNLQDNPNYQHMRHHTPSASPPVANGVPYHARLGTPPVAQQHISRPSSTTGARRMSSNLVPQQQPQSQQQHHHQQQQQQQHQPPQPFPPQTLPSHSQPQMPQLAQTQAPPNANGMAYLPQAGPGYNSQAAPSIVMPPDSSQAGPYQPYPAQAAPPRPQPGFVQEHARRPSMPPTFPQERPPPVEDGAPPPPSSHHHQGLMAEPKRPIKARSIFTPVDDNNSFLAKYWGTRTSDAPSEVSIKEAPPPTTEPSTRAQSVDIAAVSAHGRAGKPPNHTRGNTSMSSLPEIAPPQRTGSAQWGSAPSSKRPQLKVQIPDEVSDGGSADATSSPHHASSGAGGGHPSTKGGGAGTEGSHASGVVLPPPSPSASALLSAGAQGPPNPFARPNPPTSAAPNNNNNGSGNNNNIDTPMSALPTRFMADALLPSPSTFYPEWNFGRGGGGESNLLPSPLNFQTPIAPTGPSFSREEPDTSKRKSPDGDEPDGAAAKRVKT